MTMRRVAFKSKLPAPRPCKVYEGQNPSAPRAQAVRISDGRARMVVPMEKGPKSKPGKRTPNKREAAWLGKVVQVGCIACFIDGQPSRPTAVHHMLRGGVRMGHLFSFGLCDPGHHQGGQPLGLISRHPWRAQFERRYGTELELPAMLKRELGYFDDWKVA